MRPAGCSFFGDSIELTIVKAHAPFLPQVMRPALLRSGFELVQRDALEVTDDVSIIEALGERVKITYGAYSNIKVPLIQH